jgi:hypothetical protein
MQLGKDSLAYLIAYSFSIGENLSNSTMLAGAGKLVDDVRSITRGVQSDNKTKGSYGSWIRVCFLFYSNCC